MPEQDKHIIQDLEYLLTHWDLTPSIIDKAEIDKEIETIPEDLKNLEITIAECTSDLEDFGNFENLRENKGVIDDFVKSAKEIGLAEGIISGLLRNKVTLEKVANKYKTNQDKYDKILKLKKSLENAQKHPLVVHAEHMDLYEYITRGNFNKFCNGVGENITNKHEALEANRAKSIERLEVLKNYKESLVNLEKYFGLQRLNELVEEATEMLGDLKTGIENAPITIPNSVQNALIKKRKQQIATYLFNVQSKSKRRVSFSENAQLRTYRAHSNITDQEITPEESKGEKHTDFKIDFEKFNKSRARLIYHYSGKSRSVLHRTRSRNNLPTHEQRANSARTNDNKPLRRTHSM